MDVYNQPWNFEPMDIVFIDCVHDYQHIKSDIDNTLNSFNKPILVFDDYCIHHSISQLLFSQTKFSESQKPWQ